MFLNSGKRDLKSFRPKIVRDQLCYTVDLDKIKQRNNFKEGIYFTFYIDYNEDREFSITYDEKSTFTKNEIIVETIGNYFQSR